MYRVLCGSPGMEGIPTGVTVNTSIQPRQQVSEWQTPAASKMNEAAIHLSGG